MRHITIPAAITLTSTKDGTKQEFTFSDYLEEVVWGSSWWRGEKDGTSRLALLRAIVEKFADTKAGMVVSLNEAEYEAFRPLAMQAERPLPPGLATKFLTYFEAVADASSRAPSAVVDAVPASDLEQP